MLTFRVGEVATQQGLTQRALAARSGLARSTIQRYWHGEWTHGWIYLTTLAKLCEALNAQPGDLMMFVRQGENDG